MKKYLFISLIIALITPSVALGLLGYIPTTVSPCVNDSCRGGSYATDATAGDKISLVAQDLDLADKVMVEDTIIENWSLRDKYILEFFLPDNIKNDASGYASIRVYFSDGNLIAMGNLKIYSESISPPTPKCTADIWTCGNYSSCSVDGTQSRNCTKTFECSTDNTPPPITSQDCIPPQPSCTMDIWVCDDWNSCSPSGIQNRNCKRTFDCPIVENAPPAISQYCETYDSITQQTSPKNSDKILNQNTQKTTEQQKINSMPEEQKESTITVSTDANPEINPIQNNLEPVKKVRWYQKIFSWFFNWLF